MTAPLSTVKGQRLETLVVCVDMSCRRCLRCMYWDSSMKAVKQFALEQSGLQALTVIMRQALDAIAQGMPEGEAKTGLLQIINLTEAEAAALLNPAPTVETEAVETAPPSLLVDGSGLPVGEAAVQAIRMEEFAIPGSEVGHG